MKVQTEDKNLIRDTASKALLNKNKTARDQIQMAREKARKSAQLEQRVDSLEKELKELKEMIAHGAKV